MGRVWLAGMLTFGVVAFGAGIAAPGSAEAAGQCVMFSGTADGIVKEEAVGDSRSALQEEIDDWKTEHHVRSVVTRAAKPSPKPYWRDQVASDLYVRPDVVDAHIYTVCWRGVVSPVVCTSGARFCH